MSSRRRVAVLTTGRQDYGILRSTLHALAAADQFELLLLVGGMHLNERFGRTVELVRADGLPIAREVPFVAEPPDAVEDTGRATAAVGAALADLAPEMLVLVGDRHETLAAAVAAVLQRVPLVHLHGGEETEGAVDNAFRHAITKLSHLHLVSHPLHARRVVQMGEDPATVHVIGSPSVDNAFRSDLPGRPALERDLGLALRDPVVLVTLHPATLGEDAGVEVAALGEAMARVPATYVITLPNADPGGTVIREYWRRWAEGRPNVQVVEALGEARYWALLRIADAVLGNSSSGILEAPALGVPVVNVGDRQKGRVRLGRVADVPAEPGQVEEALRAALVGGRATRDGGGSPAGPVAPRVVEILSAWSPPVPPRKRFVEATWTEPA